METKAAELTAAERLWIQFEHNKKQVLWGAAIVVVAGIAVGFYMWHSKKTETDANTALSRVLTRNWLGTRTPNSPEALSKTAADLLKVAAEHAGTAAGSRALLLAGADFFAVGQYDQARSQFEKYLSRYGDRAFVDEALLGKAACLEAQGMTNEAFAAYNDVTQRFRGSSTVAQAKFAMARILERQDKWQQAVALYRELEQEQYRNFGSIVSEAGIRIEELMRQHPETGKPATAAMAPGPTSAPPAAATKAPLATNPPSASAPAPSAGTGAPPASVTP